MDYSDKTIMCVEDMCDTPGKTFEVTVGEQEWLANKGFPLPKRCKDCRNKKKNRANSPFIAVAEKIKRGDFTPDSRGHGKKNNRRTGRERMNDYDEGQGN